MWKLQEPGHSPGNSSVTLCGKSETFRTSSGGAAWASRLSPFSTELTRALWPDYTTHVPRLDCHIRKGKADAPWTLNKWNRAILRYYNSESTTEKQVRSSRSTGGEPLPCTLSAGQRRFFVGRLW